MLETCINVLKEQPRENGKEQCNFSFYVADKLQKFDGKTSMVAENPHYISNLYFNQKQKF